MAAALKRKRESQANGHLQASTSKQQPLTASKTHQESWPELLKAIQGGNGESGAILALHQLCKVISSQAALGLSASKKPADHAFAVWQGFLSHWAEDPTFKDLLSVWERGEQTGNIALTVAALQTYAAILSAAGLPSSGILAVGSAHQAAVAKVVVELINQLKYIKRCLVQQGKNDLTTAALELLAALLRLVRHTPARNATSRKIWHSLDLDAKTIVRLLGTRRKTPLVTKAGRKPDIRHLLLNALVSLLSPSSSLAIKQDILSLKGLPNAIFKTLSEDPQEVIEAVLEVAARCVSDVKLDLELRCRVADDSWAELIKLYDSNETSGDGVSSLRISAQRYLLYVSTVLARPTSNASTLHSNAKRVLGSLLGQLSTSDSEAQIELAAHVLSNTPDLLPGFWAKFAPSLEPRLSSRWVTSVGFATKIVSSPGIQLSIDGSGLPTITQLADSSSMPANLGRLWLSKALQQADSAPLVAYLACDFLHACLHKAASIIQEVDRVAGHEHVNTKIRFRQEIAARLPDLQVLISLAQKGLGRVFSRAGSLASTNGSEAVSAADEEDFFMVSLVLRTLNVYHSVIPQAFSSLRFDFGRLLGTSLFANGRTSSAFGSFDCLGQAALLELVTRPADTETGEGAISWQWSKSSEGARSPVASIIHLSITALSPSLRAVAQSAAIRLLTTSLLFEHDASECKAWLWALPRTSEYVESGLSFLDTCIQRCLQTPFKYIDQLGSLTSNCSCANARVIPCSPLLATILEQLPYRLNNIPDQQACLSFCERLVICLAAAQDCTCILQAFVDSVTQSCATKSLDVEASNTLQGITGQIALLSGRGDARLGGKAESTTFDPVDPLRRFLHTVSDPKSGRMQIGNFGDIQPVHLVGISRLAMHVLASGNVHAVLDNLRICFEAGQPDTRAAMHDIIMKSQRLRQLAEKADGQHEPALRGMSTNLPNWTSLTKIYTAVVGFLAEFKQSSSARPGLPSHLMEYGVSSLGHNRPSFVLSAMDLFSFEQLKEVLVHSLSSSQSVDRDLLDVSVRAAHRLQEGPTGILRDIAQEHWHSLLAFRGDEIVGLLAGSAESLLPFGVSTADHDAMNLQGAPEWVSKAALNILGRGIKSGSDARLVAVAVYADPKVYETLESQLSTLTDFATTASTLQAFFEVTVISRRQAYLSTRLVQQASDGLFSEPRQRAASSAFLTTVACLSADTSSAVLTQLGHKVRELAAVNVSATSLFNTDILACLVQVRQACRTVEAFALIESYLNESLRWLVRRFAEDPENTAQVSSFIQLAGSVIAKHHGKWLFKAHLVEPVIMASLQNRLLDTETLTYITALTEESKLSEPILTRLLQTLLADSRLRSALSITATSRDPLTSLLESILKQLPSSAHVPRIDGLLAFYSGSLTRADRALLNTFRIAEVRRQMVLKSLTKSWVPPALRGLATSFIQVIGGLDPRATRRSSVAVLSGDLQIHPEDSGALPHEPVFLLALLGSALDLDEVPRGLWLSLASSGLLGLAICAIACKDELLRLTGDRLLARARNAVSTSDFREKDEISYILEAARHLVSPESSLDDSFPPMTALFLAESLISLGTPEAFQYPAVWRYILSRPTLDTGDVPLLYNLLYSASDNAQAERLWLLRFLRDSVHSSDDWFVLRRRQVAELLIGFLQSDIAAFSNEVRLEILKVFERLADLPTAVGDLVGRHGLFDALAQCKVQTPEEASLVSAILEKAVGNLQPSKLRRARDGLWIVEATAAMKNAWLPEMTTEHLRSLTHTARLLSRHVPIGGSELVLGTVCPLLLDVLAQAVAVVKKQALYDTQVCTALYDSVCHLDYIWQTGESSAVLFRGATLLALAANVPGVKDELIRAWHTV